MRGRNIKTILYYVEKYKKAKNTTKRPDIEDNALKAVEWNLSQIVEASEIDFLPEGVGQMAAVASLLFEEAKSKGETTDDKRMQFMTGALWALQWARAEVKRKKPNHSIIQRRQPNEEHVLQPKLPSRQNLSAESQE